MCLEGESMINKLKKIEILTKIFVKDFYQRTKLINKDPKTSPKIKSIIIKVNKILSFFIVSNK